MRENVWNINDTYAYMAHTESQYCRYAARYAWRDLNSNTKRPQKRSEKTTQNGWRRTLENIISI